MSGCYGGGMPALHLGPSHEWSGLGLSQGGGRLVAGSYLVGGVLGVGTYGEVRYGMSIATGERVAIKIVDLGRFNTETATLMRREIQIMRLLQHERCIRLVDVHENVPFSGRWCESCACTNFKAASSDDANRKSSNCKIQPPSPNLCAVCSHPASEHAGVNPHHHPLQPSRPLFPTPPHSPISPNEADDDDEAEGGETRQVLLIVQELAAGGELFSLVSQGGALPEDVARFYFQQLVDGLEHMHSLHITHRDLKLENLILSEDFQLKITDFGLASLGTKIEPHPARPLPPDDDLIRHFSGVGSQPYSAPENYYIKELYGGRGYRGPPSDVWSAAVLLFVLLTGRPPFVRPLAKTYGAHLRRCRHFVDIISGRGMDSLSPHARDLLQRMLKLSPSERISIAEIKKHPWLQGSVPTHEELCKTMMDRAMRVWSGINSDMQFVLSDMRTSKSAAPSNTNTPLFGAISPSCSPAFGSMHSPSFSASSVPPSPYFAAAHPHSSLFGGRAHSPDVDGVLPPSRPSTSPAPFSCSLSQPPSALFSPASLARPFASDSHSPFLPTPQARHATIHSATSTPGSAVVPPTHAPRTIASSINPTSGVLFPPAQLQVDLIDASERNNNTAGAEIPPPLPEVEAELSDALAAAALTATVPAAAGPVPRTPPSRRSEECKGLSPRSPRRRSSLAEYKGDEVEEDACPRTHKRGRLNEPDTSAASDAAPLRLLCTKRSSTLRRFSSQPALGLGCAAPALESSLSFPPRAATSLSFVTSHDNVVDLVEARLLKRGFELRPAAAVAAAATPAAPVNTTAALQSGEGECEASWHVRGSLHGARLDALLCIRRSSRQPGSDPRAPKGHVVHATKLSAACDANTFLAWFDTLANGLRDD